MCGAKLFVRQEVLSGIAERPQHEALVARLRESFPVVPATEGDTPASSRPDIDFARLGSSGLKLL